MNMIYDTVLFDASYAIAEPASQKVFATFGKPTWSWGSRGG